jgi:argininosuccinate lyase
MLGRDLDRLKDAFRRTDVSPLGSAALAGATFPIDRRMVAEDLGFAATTTNSLDAVADRDFVLDALYACATIAVHLSRLSEEVCLWASAEFRFLLLDDRFSTGSSIMPQKKNPDIAELARGKSGRVFGHLLAMLTVIKGTPLAYNKDFQEDKEALFDAVDTVAIALDVLPPMLRTARFDRERMAAAAVADFSLATDAADLLARRGVPFPGGARDGRQARRLLSRRRDRLRGSFAGTVGGRASRLRRRAAAPHRARERRRPRHRGGHRARPRRRRPRRGKRRPRL